MTKALKRENKELRNLLTEIRERIDAELEEFEEPEDDKPEEEEEDDDD